MNYFPKSFKGMTVGMTNPDNVIKNLEVLTLPDITDKRSKGTYLSPTNLNN